MTTISSDGQARRLAQGRRVLGAVCLILLGASVLHARPPQPTRLDASADDATRRRVAAVEMLGEVGIPPGGTVLGTPLGGLSGITYDAARGDYYAQSDDRGTRAPARFYRLAIDLSDGHLAEGDVSFTGVVTLTDAAGQVFSPGVIDPEGIARSPAGTFFVSSEGDAAASPPVPPFVNEFGPDGRQIAALPLPAYFVPGPGIGVRNNLAFESLTMTPDGGLLVSGTESALAQDGPTSSLSAGSWSRVLAWHLATRRRTFEHVYPVSPIPKAPNPPDASADNGLVELAALDDAGTYLALERSYATGVGTTIRLFELSTAGATDVTGRPALVDAATGQPLPFRPMTKRLVVDVGTLGVQTDNIEGMTLGPVFPNGRRALILVSDDNFNPSQVTQFVALALRIDPAPVSYCYVPMGLNQAALSGGTR